MIDPVAVMVVEIRLALPFSPQMGAGIMMASLSPSMPFWAAVPVTMPEYQKPYCIMAICPAKKSGPGQPRGLGLSGLWLIRSL